jgi:hypothetical protein
MQMAAPAHAVFSSSRHSSSSSSSSSISSTSTSSSSSERTQALSERAIDLIPQRSVALALTDLYVYCVCLHAMLNISVVCARAAVCSSMNTAHHSAMLELAMCLPTAAAIIETLCYY